MNNKIYNCSENQKKCAYQPYKFCEEHNQPECYFHHLELHPIKINIDFLNKKEIKNITIRKGTSFDRRN